MSSTQLKKNPVVKNGTHQKIMHTIKAKPLINYDIIFTNDLFNINNASLSKTILNINDINKTYLIFIDSIVKKLYIKKIKSYFKHHGMKISYFPIHSSEKIKTIKTVQKIAEIINDHKIARHSPIIAIGGGVLTDIVSFTASIYRRGTYYIRIPTTLVGLIDASIGVKTGINFGGYKNRLGSYYAPNAIFLDQNFLKTLDKRNIANGLAEIVKIALIKDNKLFDLLESHSEKIIQDKLNGNPNYSEIIYRSITGMIKELEKNLFEKDLKRLVDYGHSFSPTIEMHLLPKLLHGEAVAIDMAFSTLLSEQRRLISKTERNRIFNLIKKLELPLFHSACTYKLLSKALEDTTLHRNGHQNLPLPVKIGKATFVDDITSDEIKSAIILMKKIIKNEH